MTVSYQYEVASSTSGGFTRLLFMWRGSLYKLIYRELLLFLLAFGCLSALYRNALSEEQKKLFEKVVMYCDTFISLIPLSFVLGFYVAYVAGRWWQQYLAIPWPDKTMHTLALYVHGEDEHGRMLRRTLMRYLNLSLILVLRSISSAVKRRFPTMEHLIEAGFITPLELQMFQSVPSKEFNTYWIPCTWFISLLKQTRKSNRLTDPQGLKVIIEEFNDFRSKCGMLWSYDWISIPLVYTQVVTLATYSFFLAALVGRQYVDDAKKLQMEIDRYIPVFTILQFFFFMGLLKVAEQLINPFGDDDEDFELNWLIDRHTKVSYLGVDTLMNRCPPLVKDKYFDDENVTLPYTGAAFPYKKKTYRGSVHDMQVPEDQQSMFLPEILEEDEENPSPKIGSTMTSLNSGVLNDVKKGNHNNDSTSGAAGILRSQEEKFSFLHHPAYLEGDLQYLEAGIGMDMDEVAAPINQPDLFFWPSNSTLESNTSTTGLYEDISNVHYVNNSYSQRKGSLCNSAVLSDNSYESPHKVQRSISSVFSNNAARKNFDKYNSTGDIFFKQNNVKECSKTENAKRKLNRLLGRRQSSSSGQWKGVRWKPVIDDSTGDCWSDNSNLKNTKRILKPIPIKMLPQQKRDGCNYWASQTIEPIKPLPSVIQSSISHHSEPNIAVISEKKQKSTIVSSLPNIPVACFRCPVVSEENRTTQRVLDLSLSRNSILNEESELPPDENYDT